MTAIPINQIREAQRRTERAVAAKERDLLREKLKYAQRRVQGLEAALGRVSSVA